MNESIRRIEEFLDIQDGILASEGLCMLAGQFSSGKSRFLNTLIGFACLPMGTCETTDVPTYLSRGEDYVRSYGRGEKHRHTLGEVENLRKGSIDLESIQISYHAVDIPSGITFVDMPGVNSVDPRRDIQFGDVLKKSSVVLYFLGKQITMVDMLYLNKIIETGAKVLLIRTKIDRINRSEEEVRDVVDWERGLYLRLFPDIDTYFISLDEECDVNELGLLQTYIHSYLEDDIRKYQHMKERLYLQNLIRPRLLAMRDGILKNQSAGSMMTADKLQRNVKKKIRKTRRILEDRQEIFFDGFELAKKNYTKLGRRFILEQREDQILKADIDQYLLRLLNGLWKWYELELEDGLKQIDLLEKAETKKYNLLETIDIDNILNCASAHMLFGNISCYFKADNQILEEFASKREAEKYFVQVINSIFAGILMDFQNKYNGFIAETLRKYESQKSREVELVLPMIQEDIEGTLAVIDGFLKETEENGY